MHFRFIRLKTVPLEIIYHKPTGQTYKIVVIFEVNYFMVKSQWFNEGYF